MAYSILIISVILATVIALTAIYLFVRALSRRRFNNEIYALNRIRRDQDFRICMHHLKGEIDRFNLLQKNLFFARKNLSKLEIAVVEDINSREYSKALSQLDVFYEKHAAKIAGAETVLLSVLTIPQIKETLWTLGKVAPDLFTDAIHKTMEAWHAGASIPGEVPVMECFNHFLSGIGDASNLTKISIIRSIEHGNYFGAAMKVAKNGIVEMLGINDAKHALQETLHSAGSSLNDIAEATITPVDWTNIDLSHHIPVITIAMSSIREVKLLGENHTDVHTSVKNIALDATGTGGGGWAGAKVGAGIGLLFGPLGGFVGGVIGGVTGAMIGRTITQKVKEIPLRDAIDKLNDYAESMQIEIKNESIDLYDKIKAFSIYKRDKFSNNQYLNETPIKDLNIVHELVIIIYEDILEYRNSIENYINDMKASKWYKSEKHAIIIYKFMKEFDKFFNRLPNIDDILHHPYKALEQLLSIDIPKLKVNYQLTPKIHNYYHELRNQIDKDNIAILLWVGMINGDYQKTLNDITIFSNNNISMFNASVIGKQCQLKEYENKVKYEKQKLGYE